MNQPYHARIQSRVFLDQARALTLANLKVRYRKTWAGFAWVVLNPLIMYGVQALIFSKVLRLDVARYPLFLLSGLVPWLFISQTLEMSASILLTSGSIIKAYPVHPLIFVFSQIAENLLSFAVAFLIVLGFAGFFGSINPVGILLLPIAAIPLLIGVSAMSWLAATLQVFFRDVRFFLSFGLSVAYYVTPVFYPVEFVPQAYRWAAEINPFYRLIFPFRAALYELDLGAFSIAWVQAMGVAMVLLVIATSFWSGRRNAIYFHI